MGATSLADNADFCSSMEVTIRVIGFGVVFNYLIAFGKCQYCQISGKLAIEMILHKKHCSCMNENFIFPVKYKQGVNQYMKF